MDQSGEKPFDGIEFRSTRKIALQVTLALAGSLLTIVIMGVSFFLVLLSGKPNHGVMPGVIGGMGVVAVMGISFSIYMLKRPVRILLEERGLTVEWLAGRRFVAWKDIARIEPGEVEGLWQNWMRSLSSKKDAPKECLRLFDSNRRKIAEFDNDIECFAELSKHIYNRSSISQGTSTFDVEEHTTRQIKKQKKNRLLMIGIGLFLTAGGIAFGIMTFVEERDKRQLEEHGQTIQAVVSRHYIHNITPRIEYAFTAEDGRRYSEDVMVERHYWEILEEDGLVAVRYVPSNPENSSLTVGQVEMGEPPLVLAVFATLVVTGLGLLSICISLLGICDIKYEDGKFRIVRIGQVEQLEVTAALSEKNEEAQPSRESDIPYAVSMPTETPTVSERKLPGGLKAIGILNIVFGGMGVLWNLLRIAVVCLFGPGPFTIAEGLTFTGDLFWPVLSHGIGLVIALVLLISGCGILAFRNWGRILAIWCALGKVLHGVAGLILMYTSDVEMLDPEQQHIFRITMMFVVFCSLLTMIYPVLLLILLRRRSVREVFREAKRRDEETEGLTPF